MANKQRVTDAVNFLVSADNCARLMTDIRHIVDTWDTYPMAYAGNLAILNSLIDVGLENKEVFERLLALVEAKRKEIPALKKLDYQRTLMAERRRREHKAVALRELQIGPLKPAAKQAYFKEVRGRWAEAREKWLKDAAPADGHERIAAIREFWEHIDTTLDANIAAEQAKKRKKG